MIIEVHDNLENPQKFKATRVLVTTDDGTPIAFCVELVPGHYRHFRGPTSSAHLMLRAGDPDFNEQLINHGIVKTTVVKKLE